MNEAKFNAIEKQQLNDWIAGRMSEDPSLIAHDWTLDDTQDRENHAR
jgi:hypothetical protein